MSNATTTNGKRSPGPELTKRTHQVREEPPDAGAVMPLPPWLQSLRDAMGTSIQGDDLKAIMAAQVKKAKDGDRGAAQFVMNQAHRLLQSEQKRVSIIQNNYYDTPADQRPDAPVEPGDDRDKRIRKLTARAAAGEQITGRDEDRLTRPVGDDEEKALRRRQQADEEDDTRGPEGD